MKGGNLLVATAILLDIASPCLCFFPSTSFLPHSSSPLRTSIVSEPARRHAATTAAAAAVGPRMAVGDLVSLGNVQELDQLPVGTVQTALKAALADGHKLIELEVPTTNRFKDQPLNVILQYNTRVSSPPPLSVHPPAHISVLYLSDAALLQYIRELVRCFTQPQEICIVFPDKKECEYAVEDYGGDVPFYITPLDNPRVADMATSVDKVFVMNPVFDVREYVNTEALWTQVKLNY